MIKNFTILCRYFLFWLLFFFLERLTFLLWFSNRLKETSIAETSKSFIVGIWMDASMTAYICVLPLLISLLIWFVPSINLSSKILQWYTSTLIGLFSIICIFNANIYREWGSKINYKALDLAFNSPKEAIASGASSPILLSISVLIALILLSFRLSKRIICYQRLQKQGLLIKTPLTILFIGLNFLAIRGGWQLSPMNESMAYYSNSLFLNHATVNTEWALLRDILNNKSTKNPYQYYTKQEAKSIVKDLFKAPQTPGLQILTTAKPNVILIIMESFTADVVESLGGEKGITPQIERLATDGILFDNIYASGDRTDKGVIAVLNGFPAQPFTSIMKLNSKQIKLPSLSQTFSKVGYPCTFFYGGESEFTNMKSYLISHNFTEIIDKNSFEHKDMNSKWGAFDDVVYKRLLEHSNNNQQPFFSTLLTLTNHEPFELPVTPHFKGTNVEDKFRSTAYYADSCLGAFIDNARKEPWYKNTLFIVVADHGHRLPKNESEIYNPKRFHIPLLFFGDVIKQEFRGDRISTVGSQTDIASTLFTQLNMPASQFEWSRDLLNPVTADFAFFNWNNGFGVVNAKQSISFDNVGKTVLFRKKQGLELEDKNLLHYGKAYMQQVYQQFLDY